MSTPRTIRIRQDEKPNWESKDPTLAIGELGFEIAAGKFKIGNGDNDWNNLPYATKTVAEIESEYATINHTHTGYEPIITPKLSGFNVDLGVTHANAAYGDHTHNGFEPVITSKGTAFNKDFGTDIDTVAEGNHTHDGFEPVISSKGTAFNVDFGTAHENVAYGDHTHTGFETSIGNKGTAFNKDFGIIAGTISEGNHTHASYIIGNPSADGYLLSSLTSGVRSWVAPYEHPNTDGTYHVPVTGTTNDGKVLQAGSTPGDISWKFLDWTEVVNAPDFALASHNHDAIYEPKILNASTDGYILSSTGSTKTWIAPYSLPNATDSILGGVKIGSGIDFLSGTISWTHPAGDGNLHVSAVGSSNENKVLTAGKEAGVFSWEFLDWSQIVGAPELETKLTYPTSDGYLLSSLKDGTKSWVEPYSLPEASSGALGGVKIGSGINVTDGTISVPALQYATSSTLGGVIIGSGINVTDGTISVPELPKASTSTLGGVTVDGTTIVADANGKISVVLTILQAASAGVPTSTTLEKGTMSMFDDTIEPELYIFTSAGWKKISLA